MSILYVLIPVTIGLGLVALLSFIWSVRSRQYEDLAGAAERILLDEDAPRLPIGARNAGREVR